jgi:NitT/TauT family transport system permease protein
MLSWMEIADPLFIPSSLEVGRAFYVLFAKRGFAQDLQASVSRFLAGFFFAAVLGVPAGLLLGLNRKWYQAASFPIDFFRSTPVTAVFPLFMLIFGVGDAAKIVLAGFAAFLLICFHSAQGVLHCSTERVLNARLQGAGAFRIYCTIVFWESLPQTIAGLRAGASIALVVIVVTEMFIGSDFGLGKRIIDYQITYDTALMYAVIAITGMIGYAANLLFELACRRLVHWSCS